VLEDVSEVFNSLTGYSDRQEYSELLVAPVTLRARMLGLIEREIAHARGGRAASILIKNNAVTDHQIVRALYRAAEAGVTIDLIVRGICAVRAGLPGISERIQVRSVVGRFLEHSRAYAFGNGGEPELYIGSADLMERNLDRRVETLCRITDGAIARHIREHVLDIYLRDTDRTYVQIDGRYEPVRPNLGARRVNAQQALLDWYASTASADDV
jgi:polyphosphate kinase